MCFHCECVTWTPTRIGEERYCIIKKSVMKWGIHVITRDHIGGDRMPSIDEMMNVVEDCIEFAKKLATQKISVRNILVSRTFKRGEWEHLHGWISINTQDHVSVQEFKNIYNVNTNGNFIGMKGVRSTEIASNPYKDDHVYTCKIDDVRTSSIPEKNIYIYVDNFGDFSDRTQYRVRISY